MTSKGQAQDLEREMAVLVDGPWANRWYWRDELESMQAAAARMGHEPTGVPGQLRGYVPTDTLRNHPDKSVTGGVKRTGREWIYRPEETTT